MFDIFLFVESYVWKGAHALRCPQKHVYIQSEGWIPYILLLHNMYVPKFLSICYIIVIVISILCVSSSLHLPFIQLKNKNGCFSYNCYDF